MAFVGNHAHATKVLLPLVGKLDMQKMSLAITARPMDRMTIATIHQDLSQRDPASEETHTLSHGNVSGGEKELNSCHL